MRDKVFKFDDLLANPSIKKVDKGTFAKGIYGL